MSVGGGLRVWPSHHIWHVITGRHESCVCILSFNFSVAALRVFLTRDRNMEQEMNRCFGGVSICSNAGIVPGCCGKERAESQRKALGKTVSRRSRHLSRYDSLRVSCHNSQIKERPPRLGWVHNSHIAGGLQWGTSGKLKIYATAGTAAGTI